MKYTLDKNHNIDFVLFASLENVIVLILFNIVMCSNQKMRNVFIVEQL